MTSARFLMLLGSLILLRCALTYGLQYVFAYRLGHSKKIYDIPIKPKQLKREELRLFAGILIDAVFLYALFFLGVLHFTTHTGLLQLGTFLLAHVFIVEPIYYAYHRLLHVGDFYKKHHILHHASVITSPATAFTFTMTERLSYSVLFAIPILVVSYFNLLTLPGLFIYIVLFDFINALGHFNYEYFPNWYIHSKLKWVLYSASYHALHHTQFTKNYALFMPIYDRIFNTHSEKMASLFLDARNNKPQTSTSGKH